MPSIKIKSSIVEAIQFQGFKNKKIQSDLIDMLDNSDCFWTENLRDDPHIIINTLKRDYRVDVGDFIIKDAEGKLYSCKPDIFKATYEPILTLLK